MQGKRRFVQCTEVRRCHVQARQCWAGGRKCGRNVQAVYVARCFLLPSGHWPTSWVIPPLLAVARSGAKRPSPVSSLA
ncbi:hypothetical protein XANMN_11485 [Xanthomonas phaseoli pv. manihotis str. CIO151]|nr:hypothetical protein XANMN_11485 [Xanthomonas phaseoli pv. manihotis str. CIO151]